MRMMFCLLMRVSLRRLLKNF